MAEAGLVAEQVAHDVLDRLELVRRSGADGAAALAVEVLALSTAHERVKTRAVPEVDVLDQAVAFERLQVAIDRGQLQLEGARELVAETGSSEANRA